MAETTAIVNDNEKNHIDNDKNSGPLVITAHDPERFPHIVQRGEAANLSVLRTADAQTRMAYFEERNTNPVALEANAPVLFLDAPVPVTVKTSTVDAATEIYEQGDEEATNFSPSSNEPISGNVVVTNTQILFVANDADQADSDVAIGGACVVLHAMTEDPEPSVYLQLSSDGENGGFTEVTIIPSGSSDGEDNCQKLFDALCKLIALHPLLDEDDDGMGGIFGGGMIGGGFGDDVFGDYGETLGGDGDGLVWAPSPNAEATEQEREVMLKHLDNLLVVPPGLEAKDHEENDGQFDDASEN